jgi:hypothetical protein
MDAGLIQNGDKLRLSVYGIILRAGGVIFHVDIP